MDKEIRNYLKILESSPDNVPAFDALAKLYGEQERWNELAKLYLDKAARSGKPKRVPELLFKAADVYAERLGNMEQSEECLARVLEVDALNDRALKSLKARYRERRAWDKWVALIEREAATRNKPAEKAACFGELAEWAGTELQDEARRAAYLEQALAVCPEHLESLRQLKALAFRTFDTERALALVAKEEALLAEQPEALAALHVETGLQLAEDPFQRERAIEFLGKGLEKGKKNKAAQAKLKELESLESKWQDVAKHDQEAAVKAADKREAAAIYAKIAVMTYLYAPDRVDDILGAIEKSLLLDPANRRALSLGERVLSEREEWIKLDAFWRDIFGRTRDDALRVETMAKDADLLADKLGKRDAALALYRDLLLIRPDHARAFKAVGDDLAAQEKWDELKTFYVRLTESAAAKEARAEALVGLAKLLRDREGDMAGATKRLEEARALVPTHLDAARELIGLYENTRDTSRLLDVLEIVGANDEGPTKRVALKRAGELFEAQGKAKEAFARDLDAFRLDPEDSEVWERLEALGLELENWEALVTLLTEVLGRDPKPSSWRKLAFRLGQIHDRELSDYAEAEKAYRSLLDEGADRETLDALIRLYTKDAKWERLVEILGLKAEKADDKEERRDILLERARILEEELMDEEGAIACYEAVVQVDPQELEALTHLESLLAGAKRYDKLADVLDQALAAVTSLPEKIKLNMRLGDICRTSLKDNERAARAYLAVLALDPAHKQAINKLEPLLNEGVLVGAIFRGLEAHYVKKGQFDKLADGYAALIGAEADEREKGELCFKLADLLTHRMTLPDRAYEWIIKGLATPFVSRAFLELALDTAQAVGQTEALLDALEKKGAATSEPALATTYAVELGGLLWERLHDAEGAARHYGKAVELAPADPDVLRAACAFFDATDRAESFATWGLALARQEKEPKARRAAYRRTSDVLAHKLDRRDEAQAALLEWLAVDAADVESRLELVALQQAGEQWTEVAAGLAECRRLLLARGEEAARDVALRLADVLEAHVHDDEAAAALVGELLLDDKADGRALALAERFLAEGRAEKTVAGLLQPIYEAQRNTEKLIGVLERLVRLSEGDEARALCSRIAALYEDEQAAYGPALEWYGKAFLLEPGIGLMKELQLASEMAEDPAGFVRLGDEKLTQDLETSDRIDLLFAMADVAVRALHDPAQAAVRYEAITQRDDHNERAVDALIDLARAGGDPEAQRRWLEAKRAIAAERQVRRDVTIELANLLWRTLHDAARATAVLGEQLEERENDPPVLDLLDAVLTDAEDWAGLAVLLERRLKYQREDQEILPLKIRLADLLAEKLERHDDALAIYLELARDHFADPIVAPVVERLLTQERTELAVAREMEPKYIKAQDWKRLVGVYEIELRHASDAHEKAKLLAKLSGIYQDKLQDADKAFEGFARVFIDDPLNEAAQAELEKLASDLGTWKELSEVYEKAGDNTPDDALATELFIKAARLYEDILAFQEDAIRAYRRVLGRDRNHMTAIQALEGLCRKTERWEELRDIYLQRIELSGDVGEKRELYANICILYEHQLEDPLGATPYYEAMLALLPSDLDVVEKLAGLYVVSDNFASLASLYGHKIDLLDDERARNALRLEKAALHEDKLNESAAAKDLYKTVLTSDPDNKEALDKLEYYVEDESFQDELARFLVPFYREKEQWKRLIDMQEYVYSHSQERTERTDLLKDMAITYEERLDQKSLAFAVLARAFKEEPTDDYTQGELERLSQELDRNDQLLALYDERLAALDPATDAATLIALRLVAAPLAERKLDDKERAAAHYREILVLDGEHREALNQLERLYHAQQKWLALIDILERKLPLQQSLDDRKSLLFKICNIFEEELGDHAQAVTTYHRILELDGADRDVLAALVRLNTTLGRFDDLLVIRERQLALAENDAERWELRQAMGLVMWHELNRIPDAIGVFKGILNENHHFMPAREALEVLVGKPDYELTAAFILEPLYAEDEKHDDLIQMLAIEARHEEKADVRRDLFLRMAELAERKVSDPARAFGYTLDALVEDAFNAEIRTQAERLARAVSGWYDLAAAYEARAQAASEPAQQIDLYLQAGRVALDECDDPKHAEPLFAAVRALDGANATALDALEVIFARLAKWTPLVDVLMTKATLTDSTDAQVAFYMRSADVREGKLNDLPLAVSSYLDALGKNPDYEPALAQLDRLYDTLGEHGLRADILERRARLAPNAEARHALTFQRGRVVEERLNQPEAALAIYRSILAEDDEYADALSALESLVLTPTWQDEALAVLTPLYEAKGWWERLAGLLDAYLDTLRDPAKRQQVLTRIKEIFEDELRDAARAFATACRLYREDVYNLPNREEMERLAVVTGGFEGLVQTYRSFLDQLSDLALKVELQTKVATLYEDPLHDEAAAIDAWRAVLALAPQNLDAMQTLDRLLERTGRYKELVALIPQKIALLADAQVVIEERLRLGRLYEEKLDDLLTAVDVYNVVTSEHPDHPQALSALEHLYEALGLWPELIGVYKSQVRIARGDTKKAHLYAKMAEVYADKLGERREAIPLWGRVLQFDEQNVEVMEKLEKLYLAEEMWDDLITHYKKRQRLAHTAAERAGIVKSMAFLYRDRLGQEDRATQLFLKVLEYTPDDLAVIDALEAIYLANQAWSDLSALLERLVTQVQGAEQRSITLRMSAIALEHLDDEDEGERLARQVLDMEPTAEELTRLERLFAERPNRELYLAILEKQAACTDDLPTRTALHFRMADIEQHARHDEQAARRAYEKVLELVPGHLQAAEMLEPIYRRASEWGKLVEVLRIRLAEAATSEEMSSLQRALAELYEQHLDDPSAAFDSLASVLALEPHDENVLGALERLAGSLGRYFDLAARLSDLLPSLADRPKLQRAFTLKVAELYETKAVDAEKALSYYKQVLDMGEYHAHAVDVLIATYEAQGAWESLIDAYHLKVPHMNLEEKVVVGCRVAAIFDEHLGQARRSVKTYEQVLKMDEHCPVAIDALVRIHERDGKWAELVEALRRKLHIVSEPADLSAIRLRMAELYQNELNDLKQAKVYYRALLADDPKHLRALDELERIYASEENYDELLEVLSRRVNVVETDAEKLAIYRKMADIWDVKFGQRDMAVTYLEKMLAIKPDLAEAIHDLERIYRDAEDWQALAQTYQRHIDWCTDADTIVRLYSSMGQVYGEHLDKPALAIEYLTRALTIDDRNVTVLAALADLYLAGEQWNEAIATFERLAEVAPDKTQRVNALARLGRVYQENLGDRQRAKDVYDRMMKADPTFVPAIKALRQYYASLDDWPRVLKLLEEEKRHAKNPADKAEAFFEEGRYWHEQEGDVERALGLYRQALTFKDDLAPLLKVLSEIGFEREAWDETKPLIEKLLSLPDGQAPETAARAHYRLAFIAEREGEDAEALRHYMEAYKLDSNHLQTLEGLARALYKRGEWDRAFRVYQTILVRFREQKSVEELVDVFCRLGDVNGKLGKHDIAVRMYEKALELDPQSVRALGAIVYYYESLESWKKVLQYRSRLIKIVEGEELFEQWRAVGDVYAERLGEREKGLEAYRFALEVKADDVPLLNKVADYLLEAGNVADAIGVLRSAANLEKQPESRFALNLKLAGLIRQHDGNPMHAIEFYNAALDLHPERDDLFAIVEQMLVERQDWDNLDQNYRLMIARLPNEDVTRRVALWKKLGDLLSQRAGNLGDAIKVFEVLLHLAPQDRSIKERLADLYTQSASHREQAISMHRLLLGEDWRRTASQRALMKLFDAKGETDHAFAYANVLTLMGESDAEVESYLSEHQIHPKQEATSPLSSELWGLHVLPANARHNAGQILAILYHHMEELMPGSLKNEGLKKKDHLDPEDPGTFMQTLQYLCETLGVQVPDVYIRPDFAGQIEPLAIQPATLVVDAEQFQDFDHRELVFLSARAAVLARPDFLVGLLLPANLVRALLDASAQLYNPNFIAAGPAAEVTNLRKRIDRSVPRKLRDMLGSFCGEYMTFADGFDMEPWRRALILAAHRAGYIMCHDLTTAVRMTKRFPGALQGEALDEVLRDMVDYSLSDSARLVRRELGFDAK